MLLNNDRKIDNKAMFQANPQAVVPRQTLNSLLNSAKAKINAVTSGDLGTELDIYQCVLDHIWGYFCISNHNLILNSYGDTHR